MLFWIHAAVAYLVYRGVLSISSADRSDGVPVIALIGGALFPDIIDKPLSFVFTSLLSRSIETLGLQAIVILVVGYVTFQAGLWGDRHVR